MRLGDAAEGLGEVVVVLDRDFVAKDVGVANRAQALALALDRVEHDT